MTKGFDLSNFKIDKEKEIEGVWEDIGNGAKLLIARAGNKAFQKEYSKVPRGIRRMMENGTLDETENDDIICDVLSKTLLLDWKNILDEGKAFKYSQENAKTFLLKYPVFRETVWDMANDFKLFHDASIEDDAKNSTSASDGS